jgi:hypothetical protein
MDSLNHHCLAVHPWRHRHRASLGWNNLYRVSDGAVIAVVMVGTATMAGLFVIAKNWGDRTRRRAGTVGLGVAAPQSRDVRVTRGLKRGHG